MPGLHTIAEADLAVTLEDAVNGFGWAIMVTPPIGAAVPLVGAQIDIAQVIDPDTGQAVSGRLASVSLRISSLTDAGLTLPVGIADASIKPWLIAFEDIGGMSHTFKVSQSNPDHTLGILTLLLEAWKT